MRGNKGFSLIEILISAALVAVAAMAGVAYVTRGTQHADWAKDRVFARQKALSILAEMRAYVEGGEGEVAADLDGFDDGLSHEAALSIQPDPNDPGAFLAPNHALSSNIQDNGLWRWYRQVTVRRFPGAETRDLRICTVKMFRMRRNDTFPGEQMAEVSSVIKTVGDAFPTTQVYDIYLLAMDNVPGWWVYMDAIQPFVEATVTDLESRNPGLKFRTHWISKTGYGRDQEYAPYTNESRDSRANTPWTYAYPGRMPSGMAAVRYYVPERIGARINLDGENAPLFVNDTAPQETYTDTNSNGRRDPGEPYTDANANGVWDMGNPVPYAMADMQNHCMRHEDEQALFAARVAAGVETDDTPTYRLLLDRMIASPNRYHNAILINLHGELVPMPPVRNYSDAAKIPEGKPGWRVVTHPERIRPLRVPGDDSASDPLRWRVYGYKTEFDGVAGGEQLITQKEPYLDLNKDGVRNGTEPFQDWNGNGQWDDGDLCVSLVIPGGDLTSTPNAATNASINIQALRGGINADGVSGNDPYQDWSNANRYPETFTDSNSDGRRQIAETFVDLNGDGTRQSFEPFTDEDGDGVFTPASEALTDANGNGWFDGQRNAEAFVDSNSNNRWDAAEPYWDVNGNGTWDAPGNATPPTYQPWAPTNSSDYQNTTIVNGYVFNYGEPMVDRDNNQTWSPAESFYDSNQNGVRDGGWERGEMWFAMRYDSVQHRTLIELYGTPLETPYESSTQRGLNTNERLYDLEYIPCPTPSSSSSTSRWRRDLYEASSSRPKNTARWVVEIPGPSLRSNMESIPGAGDGDTRDRVLSVETRIGNDTSTGTKWPTWNQPSNLSRSHCYFYSTIEIPFSERYQFLGDPRHCPYTDLDGLGSSFPHGYNWYFDNFQSNGDGRSDWQAFDSGRLKTGWKGNRGSSTDVPRLMSFLRTALARTEAIYTTLTGFSYYYMSIGGDIGYDSANGFGSSIPMDGKPFGLGGNVYESTITDGIGTSSIRGSRKYVRSNDGDGNGIRSSGYWWSKPWMGELWQDSAYASQWKPWGNLRANTGTSALDYRLVRAGDITATQQPDGTNMNNAYARLQTEGCVSLFNIGSSSSTFHHQFENNRTGTLTEDGPELADNYNFPLPTTTIISRPFGLATSGAGGTGDEFGYTAEYPRFSAQMVRKFYNHQNSQTGSGLVRLREPGANPRGAYIVVNGIDKTSESGSSFIARFSMLSLIHSYFAGGRTDPNRIRQLPRVEVIYPRLETELQNPASIPVTWKSEWKRWDGLKYTTQYPDNFTEDETDLVHVPMYSKDGGKNWLHMTDNSVATPGTLPWNAATSGPDLTKALFDANQGAGSAADEVYTWATPAADFPQGSYVIRVDTYRASEQLHYSQHKEKIYVDR